MLAGGKSILLQLENATRSLELVSPTVGGAAVEEALGRSPARRKRLITRYRPFDILAGTTDLALLARLRKGVEIRFLEDVHARLYIADGRWAYVGSSLLTRAGLDESGADVGLEVSSEAECEPLRAQFARLWAQAVELTPAQWMLALHATDHALEIVEHARQQVVEAERALTRFVGIPRLRTSPPAPPLPAEPSRRTPEFVRRRMEGWAGSPELARQVAEFLAWTIQRIPNAHESSAWTVLLGERHLRLKLGLPEIFGLEESDEGCTLTVMGLGDQLCETRREQLRKSRATVAPSPYASATGLSREALRIGNIPLRDVPALLEALKPGLETYVSRHWNQAPALGERAFAPSVLEYLEDELDQPLPWPKNRVRSGAPPT